ncbi:MAG: ABC transporter permease [Blautia sp.]|nr:ABC transporter permease [Blautia sp.]
MSSKMKKTISVAIGTVGMVVLSLVLGGILVVLTGNSPLEAYMAIWNGAFGSPLKISELFVKVTPIMIMAFGVSIAYRAQLWNIGASGQFIMGSIASAAVALYVPLPFILRIPASLIAAIAAGALWAGIAGVLKNRFNANEVITTSLLTYIANYFLLYVINGPMQDPESDLSQSALMPEEMHLPTLFKNYRIHIGIFILLAVIIFMIIFWKTTLGYRINLIGQGEKVSTYAGVNMNSTVIMTLMISGAFCGLAGWIEMFGIQFRVLDGIAADYGNIATIIALLGSLNVYGIIAAAAFFSVLLCGGASMQRMTEVPYSVVNVIQGLIIILVIARDRMGESISKISVGRKEKKS